MLAVAETYIKGVSTREVEAVMRAFGIESPSSSQVSRAAKLLDDELETWRTGLSARSGTCARRCARSGRRAGTAPARSASQARTRGRRPSRGYANGYKPKRIDTPAGMVTVDVPKTAGHGGAPFYATSPGPCSIRCSRRASTAVSFRSSIRASPWVRNSSSVRSRDFRLGVFREEFRELPEVLGSGSE